MIWASEFQPTLRFILSKSNSHGSIHSFFFFFPWAERMLNREEMLLNLTVFSSEELGPSISSCF